MELWEMFEKWENGGYAQDEAGEAALFQKLIDDGVISSLQGSYRRRAISLIETGRCHMKRCPGGQCSCVPQLWRLR
jgi:hypothetical protein